MVVFSSLFNPTTCAIVRTSQKKERVENFLLFNLKSNLIITYDNGLSFRTVSTCVDDLLRQTLTLILSINRGE